ncbi:unnamed protein product [Effrenium voratum]|nr:unnamed protein product [Effrenium voratum]
MGQWQPDCFGRVLGSGSFAVVAECTCSNSQGQKKTLAAKVFKESTDGGPFALLHEAEFLRATNGCPFIAQSLGSFNVDASSTRRILGKMKETDDVTQAPTSSPNEKRYFLLMEMFDFSLRQVVNQRYLSEAESAFVTQSVLQALSFLHAKSIMHGDVKPGNVLIGDCGRRVVLADLGIAQMLKPGMKTTSWVQGTLGYTAPECLAKARCGLASDMFSLGAVLYLLLFQQEAFLRSTVKATNFATLRGDLPVKPWGAAVGLSQESCHLLRCLLGIVTSRPSADEALKFEWFLQAADSLFCCSPLDDAGGRGSCCEIRASFGPASLKEAHPCWAVRAATPGDVPSRASPVLEAPRRWAAAARRLISSMRRKRHKVADQNFSAIQPGE